MAMINCPNCNKEISDKASVCVGCGYQLDKNVPREQGILTDCPECGIEISALVESCPNCGYPLHMERSGNYGNKNSKNILKKKSFFGIILCVILLITLILLFGLNGQKKEKYNLKMCSAVDKIVEVAAETQTVENLVCSVWHNAIWEKDNADTSKYTSEAKDFNEALANLFSDAEFINKIQNIRESETKIDTYLRELKAPPKKFVEVYNSFKELYFALSDYADFVISCNGSYNSYTEDARKKNSVLMDCYRKIKVLIYTN